MAKLLKILGKGFLGLLEWVLIIIFLLVLAIRSPKFQTYAAQKATSFLSEELQARIEIEKVDIRFFDRVYLKGIFVEDHKQDTLAAIELLEVNINALKAKQLLFKLDEVKLQNARVNLKTYKGEKNLNLQYIVDYFKSDKPASPTPNFVLNARSLILENVDFSLIDENKALNPYGVDYDHMHFKNTHVRFSDLNYTSKGLVATLDHLSTQENFSGFQLDELSGKVKHSGEGIFFEQMIIKTAETDLKAEKLALITHSYGNYLEFVDSVDFDVSISGAKVSMRDVSMFAPELKGMTDIVHLDVKASDRIKNLNLKDVYLQFGLSSYIAGDFILPDFREMDDLQFNELIKDFYITLKDLEGLHLPESAGDPHLLLPQQVMNFDYVNGSNVYFTGNLEEFKLKAKNIRTALGIVHISRDLAFHYHPEDAAYFFGEFKDSSYYIDVEDFQLGNFLGLEDFGNTTASFAVSGYAPSFSEINFSSITGFVERFDYRNYPYSNITIEKGQLIGNQVSAQLDMQDKLVDLQFDGDINFSDKEFMQFEVAVDASHLEALNLGLPDSVDLKAHMKVDLKDYTKASFKGAVNIADIHYAQSGKSFDLEKLEVKAERSPTKDKFSLNSDYLDADMEGKFNFAEIPSNISFQLEQIFPALFIRKEKEIENVQNDFTYHLLIKDAQPVLDVLYPELGIANNTLVFGAFDAPQKNYSLTLNSPKISFGDYYGEGISTTQELYSGNLIAVCDMNTVYLNDTLNCEDFHFTSMSLGDLLDAQLSWNATKTNPTSLSWYTFINGEDDLKFDIKTSYFTIRDHRWDIRKNSVIHMKGDSLDIDNFRMARDQQFLSLDGLITNQPEDKLEVIAKDFDLSDIAGVFGDFAVKGIANITGEVATPFTDLFFTGKGNIDSLFINNEEVGDISLLAGYRQKQKKIDVEGKINYRGIETFDFNGYYDVIAKKDNLNFLLDFKGADLQVANAFMDEDVVSNIAGKLAGKIQVRGEIDAPILEGKVMLSDGNAKLQLLGANFKFGGEIEVVDGGVFLNNIPIQDEEGNTGAVVGQIFHNKFKNFNFDLTFDMEEQLVNNKFIPIDRFLVMNTKYNEDEYYYGKAYIRGTANISGSTDNLRIDVNANTRKGTWIDFPMYGASEIEEAQFIEWLPRIADSLLADEPKIDFTGVELNLNIGVTPDARLKVIFNEETGDEITAFGEGNIIIGLDNLNQLSMEGVFTVDRGNYNFVLGPYKQNFILEKGGTVQWSGSPYDATVNLQTYYKTTANLDVVVQDVMTNNGTRKDEINCYLSLNGDLMKPDITFDIKAPKANEMGKATLARIRSDQDELNRQFINLMVFKQFTPLNSGGSLGGGLDLVSTQINSLIDKLNTGANIGVALDKDELTGDNTVELGVSKEFLDDKLIVSTSFGVENSAANSATNTSNFIGDVRVEYVLNDARTMRVNVYNESNDYSVIQDNNQGQYTQGVGIHYQEDFQNLSDFKLFQYIGNLFRKEDNKKEDNKNKKKIPQEYIDNPALLNEEN
ncbi:Family of unknown function [Lishizhenia tianjinensis]|uniref:Translocation and assembly module TamB C-terminal domain-containing protein n=1 Tax=Lishizhenia tianjinensis TaxID=477690 RepID=A0A1I6XJA0_9FLAO|nr:translocation/assembly module TamB domain-containing protein [Lishizhenia tianjinensis]SFT38390.1 Family of unknown function [Lishizhenia tianjinensis]